MQVISQAQVGEGTDANYVENVMWEKAKTLFVTLNLPGGSNNDADVWYGASEPTQAQLDEIAQRSQPTSTGSTPRSRRRSRIASAAS
jgi:hypothetical protein